MGCHASRPPRLPGTLTGTLRRARLADLETGDLIFFGFTARQHAPSGLVTLATFSDFGHVAIVVRTPSGLSIAQATRDERIPAARAFGPRSGTGRVPLSEYLRVHKPVSVVVRRLTVGENMRNVIMGAIELLDGRDYERSVATLVASAVDGNRTLCCGCVDIDIMQAREDSTSLFCSEYVAFVMQRAGLIDPGVNCSEVTPEDLFMWDSAGVSSAAMYLD